MQGTAGRSKQKRAFLDLHFTQRHSTRRWWGCAGWRADLEDEVAGDDAVQGGGTDEGMLQRQGMDAQGQVVDVQELDAQRCGHLHAAQHCRRRFAHAGPRNERQIAPYLLPHAMPEDE